MTGKPYYFGDLFYKMVLQMISNEVKGYAAGGKLNLGGTPGPDGGTPGTPRPIIGQLVQRSVAYDTSERATPELYGTTRSGYTNSLLDNLNHIRYDALPAGWFQPTFDGTYNVHVSSGIWWQAASQYIDFQSDDIVITSPDAQPRIDVIYVDIDGNLDVSLGTPGASPSPTYPGTLHLPVCEVLVRKTGAPGITLSGIGYYYQSGVAQGFLNKDVRPFLGVNFDTGAFLGPQYLYELSDVSTTVSSPIDRDILTYDGNDSLWYATTWDLGGIGGGHPTLQVDGPIATVSGVGGAYIFTRSGWVDSVYVYAGNPGISGATIVDVNIDGVSIFANPANRPTLQYNDVDQLVKVTLSGVTYEDLNILTADIDQIAPEASDLTIVCAVDTLADTIDLGDDNVVGILPLSKLQDGTISGYPLLSNANYPGGGPEYGQVGSIGIQNDSINYDKLGDGAGKFRYRQGGDPANWADGTGANSYDISADGLKIQVGAIAKTIVTVTQHYQSFSVTFPESFANIPLITYGLRTTNLNSMINCRISSISSADFTGRLYITNDEDATVTLMWQAVGDE